MKWQERIVWLLAVLAAGVSLAIVPGGFLLRRDQAQFASPILEVRDRLRLSYVDDLSGEKASDLMNEAAIEGMVGKFDPYTQYIPPAGADNFERAITGRFEGIGVSLNVTPSGEIQVLTPMDDSPALKAGIAPLDVIVRAGGTLLKGKSFDEVRSLVTGPEGSSVELEIRKPDGTVTKITVERKRINSTTLFGLFRNADGSQQFFIDPGSKIAYVRISQFTGDTAEHLKTKLEKLHAQGMTALVLDLRFNPGGELREAVEMLNLFISEGVILRTRGTHRSEQTYSVEPGRTLQFVPMAVLVNGNSASASEIVAGALSEHRRATIVGTRTFGKGSVQEPMPLDNGGILKVTVAHYYLPSGRLLHRAQGSTEWGVDPQLAVPMTEEQDAKLVKYWGESQIYYTRAQASTRPATGRPQDAQLAAAEQALVTELLLRNK